MAHPWRIARFFGVGFTRGPWRGWVYVVASLAAVLVPLLAGLLAGGPGALLAAAVLLPVNIWLHFSVRQAPDFDIHSLRYLVRAIRCAGRIERATPGLPPAVAGALRTVVPRTRRLRRKLFTQALMRWPLIDAVVGTLNVVLLWEARAWLAARSEIARARGALQDAFLALGELDLAQSILAHRQRRPDWCEPSLVEHAEVLRATDLVHPALETAVANSVLLSRGGMVVTGSNMSGKSTWLRTLALAPVLAQSLLTVPARSYEAGYRRVGSVMGRSDDLASAKSYYLDEALAVRRLIDLAKEPGALVVLDELFHGTNSAERIAAGSSVVGYLVAAGATVVLATHDRQLAELLSPRLAAAHFAERVDAAGLSFEYRLRPGHSPGGNALDLLEHLGYPPEVVAEARASCASHRA